MTAFHEIWIEQCDATRGIRERFGTTKALGYLIGEKLLNFLRAAETRPEFAAEIPAFVAEVRDIFSPAEIEGYLDTVRHLGPLGHIATPEQVEILRAAGALDEDPVQAAEDVLYLERIRELLLVG